MKDYPTTWYSIGSFNLKFKKEGDEEKSYFSIISRACINDISLINKSKRKKKMEVEVARHDDDSGVSISQAPSNETVLEDGEIPDSLPTSFTGKQLKSSTKRKRKSQGNAKNAFLFDTFDEYWKYAGDYVTLSTWYNERQASMTEEDQKLVYDELKSAVKLIDLTALLIEHIDIERDVSGKRRKLLNNNSKAYTGISKKMDNPLSSHDELYAEHCRIVKEQSLLDFETRRKEIVTRRAEDFISKLSKLGFATGYGEANFPLKVAKKQSVQYDGGIFDDVRYDISDGFYNYRPSHQKYAKSDDDVDKITEEMKRLSSEEKPSGPVSFEFNPETEAYLVASNARKLYADDPEICKYFYQRYRLFSRLDEGIIMDREGWFSVTPEKIAQNIADRMVIDGITVIVDAFAGVGGNSIQFALKGAYVIAIDMDPVRLKCARHNARVYGVEDYISFICADFFHFAALWESGAVAIPKVDAVFLSPPWGGPSYLDKNEFDITTGCTPNGIDIFEASVKLTKNIAYYLPKNTKINQLVELSALTGSKCEIEQSSLNDKVKTITAYYGDLVAIQE